MTNIESLIKSTWENKVVCVVAASKSVFIQLGHHILDLYPGLPQTHKRDRNFIYVTHPEQFRGIGPESAVIVFTDGFWYNPVLIDPSVDHILSTRFRSLVQYIEIFQGGVWHFPSIDVHRLWEEKNIRGI